MPYYDYRCRSCGHTMTEFFVLADDEGRAEFEAKYHACADGTFGQLGRVFSFSSPSDPIGDGYYDNSSGLWVTSKRQLDDHNKAASEAHTARTGVETRFVSHDIRDVASTLKPDPD